MSYIERTTRAAVGAALPHRSAAEARRQLGETTVENALRAVDDERTLAQLFLPSGADGFRAAAGPEQALEPRGLERRLRQAFFGQSRTERPIPWDPTRLLVTLPLIHSGRSLGVLEILGPTEAIRSRAPALGAVAGMAAALLATANRAVDAELSLEEAEEVLSFAVDPGDTQESVIGTALRFCAQLCDKPVAAWLRPPASERLVLVDAWGLTDEEMHALRERMPVIAQTEVEPPWKGHAVAARVGTMLDSGAWPIVCRDDVLLVMCSDADAAGPGFRVIRRLLEIVLTHVVATAAAKRKSRRFDIALGTVAHELRAPIVVVKGLLDVLIQRSDPSKEHVELLRRSRDELSHLSSVCDAFLRWGISVDPSARDRASMHKVLQEVVWEANVDRPGREIRVTCPDDMTVFANECLLRVAVVNLVRNALAYSPEDLPVDLSVRRNEGLVSIDVTDHGSGIEADDLERIFEPFARGSSARLPSSAGTGLGLFIARRLIEAQGGSIGVDVTDGGTTFRVVMPIASDRPARSAQG